MISSQRWHLSISEIPRSDPRPGRRGSLLLTLLLALVGGCRSPESADVLEGVDPDVVLGVDGAALQAADAIDTGVFTFLGYVTADEGANATERITALTATDRRGVIAIADLSSCQVLLVRLTEPTGSQRVGRCGDGPGEFSFIGGAGAIGDTIVGFDASRRQVLMLDSSGTELRRVQLLSLLPEGFGAFNWEALWSTNQFLLTRSVGPLSIAGLPAWQTPIVAVDVGTDPATIEALPIALAPAAERSATSQQRPSMLRACIQATGSRAAKAGHIVVVQGLGVESVVLDAKQRPVVHTITRLPWMRPEIDSTGFPVPAARRWYVTCGDESYAIGYRAFEGRDERASDTRGYLEVRDYDGGLLAARGWTESDTGTRPIGSPKALVGDTLVSVVLDSAGWQRVAMWRVTP